MAEDDGSEDVEAEAECVDDTAVQPRELVRSGGSGCKTSGRGCVLRSMEKSRRTTSPKTDGASASGLCRFVSSRVSGNGEVAIPEVDELSLLARSSRWKGSTGETTSPGYGVPGLPGTALVGVGVLMPEAPMRDGRSCRWNGSIGVSVPSVSTVRSVSVDLRRVTSSGWACCDDERRCCLSSWIRLADIISSGSIRPPSRRR